ncbi:RcnB family protein [Hydrogenophaga sp. IBVHS1]|uniref:RcnB family protein n=1 Tax=unclassified Hydrogenophaga TaxID=2610897 RepID=UPI00211A3A3C|nr:RcnB family protein [Hydrogenophaga sp. IBVHS1]
MKSRNLVVIAVAAATLGMSTLSFAQGPFNGPRHEAPRIIKVDDRRDDRRDFREDRRDFREDRRDDRRDFREERREDRRDFRHSQNMRYYNARGPEFRRGHYIPREYRSRQYVVTDYRAHRLSAPPRGQQWVQVGGDYVLVAIATGIIAHLILNR